MVAITLFRHADIHQPHTIQADTPPALLLAVGAFARGDHAAHTDGLMVATPTGYVMLVLSIATPRLGWDLATYDPIGEQTSDIIVGVTLDVAISRFLAIIRDECLAGERSTV